MSLGRVRTGVLVGLIMASLYSAWVIALYLVARQDSAGGTHISVGTAVATYFAAGICGGAVIGALVPLARSWPGMMVLGVVTAVIFFFFVELATTGPFWTWQPDAGKEVAVLGVGCGLVGGVAMKLRGRR